MKIITAATTLITLINMVVYTNPAVKEAYYSEISKIDFGYNIDVGEIANTEAAEKLNKNKSVFIDRINEIVLKRNESNKKYNTKPYREYKTLTENDIDFNDPESVHTYSEYGYYYEYEYDAAYEDFMIDVSLPNDKHIWEWSICKEDTFYEGTITQNPEEIDSENLYIDNLEISIDSISIWNPSYGRKWRGDVIKDSTAKLLYEYGEKTKDIKIVHFRLDTSTTYVSAVFIDGTAKYIASYSFLVPSYGIREDAPEEIKDYLKEKDDQMYCNHVVDTYQLDELYSYNEIMYIIKLVNEWSGDDGWYYCNEFECW